MNLKESFREFYIRCKDVFALKSELVQSDWNQEDSSLPDFINNKPEIVKGLEEGSIRGINTREESSEYSLGKNAVALGENTKAEGESSFATGIGAKSEGKGSTASGYHSYAMGNFSNAEGYNTSAGGEGSHTEGNNTIANNASEHAQGQYNVSNTDGSIGFNGSADNTLFSIGNGTASPSIEPVNSKNAVEVMQNGDMYVQGIGGYDGKNYSEASTLQDMVNTQADWNQKDSTKVDYIKNKPTIPDAQVQSDWNQNDNTSIDYIKNRICYEEGKEIVNVDTEGETVIEIPEFASDIDSTHTYKAICNENGEINTYDCEYIVAPDSKKIIKIGKFALYVWKEGHEKTGATLYIEEGTNISSISIQEDYLLHKLDEKYIPDNIARKSDILQSDWNQNDSTKVDYIKNKPTIPDAQVQADWNQNDSTTKDYIKNKPTVIAMQTATNSSATASIDFNKFTYLSNVGLTSITINANSKIAGYMNEANGRFINRSVVSLASISISDGSTIQWKDGVDLTVLEANTNYIFSIIGDDTVGYFGNIKKYAEEEEHLMYGTVTPGTTSFKFYINRTSASSGGTTITVTPDAQGNWYWDNEEGYTITNLAGMFYEKTMLTSFGFGIGFDTSSITNMNSIFRGCEALTSIDVSSWDTSIVTNMSYMFDNCKSLTNIVGLSNLDTSSVTNMSYMFRDCNALTSIDVSNWDTSSVTNMSYMFRDCDALTSIDVSNLDTSSVTNMSYMFYGCDALTSIVVSNLDTSIVTNMSYMFYGCKALTNIVGLSNLDTSSVTNMSYMFRGCNALTSINVSNWDTSSVTNMSYMFYGCDALTSIVVSNLDTSRVTNMSNMFYGCNALTIINLSNWDTSRVTNMSNMFYGCNALTIIDASNWTTSQITTSSKYSNFVPDVSTLTIYYDSTKWKSSIPTAFPNVNWNDIHVEHLVYGTVTPGTTSFQFYINRTDYSSGGTTITVTPDAQGNWYWDNEEGYTITNLAGMFYEKYELTSVGFGSGFDTSSVTSMSYMFRECRMLTDIYLSNLDTSSVTDMSYMFDSCMALTSIYLSNLDTSSVTNMSGMFGYCSALTSIYLSNLDTSSVTNMGDMFVSCKALTSIYLSNLDTSSVTNMSGMFQICSALTNIIGLPNLDTHSVTDMLGMFNGCNALTSIDVSNWDTSSVTSMSYMFYNCNALTIIDASNWTTSQITTSSNYRSFVSNVSTLTINYNSSKWNSNIPTTYSNVNWNDISVA